MTSSEILSELEKHSHNDRKEGMSRFGINTSKAFGVSIPAQRKIAKRIGKNHDLALELWKTDFHEARILASMIADPKLITKSQMNNWVKDFNSWDLCDQCCNNLFVFTPFAQDKAIEWSRSKKEFIKRAGFVLMAVSAVHDKNANDNDFNKFFERIIEESSDERNFVKKAVNWALRQIGKRNLQLNNKAIEVAESISCLGSKSARWIAKDALRELKNPKTRLRNK